VKLSGQLESPVISVLPVSEGQDWGKIRHANKFVQPALAFRCISNADLYQSAFCCAENTVIAEGNKWPKQKIEMLY
jgi:hypothetical protein